MGKVTASSEVPRIAGLTMKLRLLQLAHINIVNPSTGSQLRNYQLARQLGKAMVITHLGFQDRWEERSNARSDDQIRMTLVPKDRPYTVGKLARGALGKTPVTLLNFQSAAMAVALADTLAAHRYDIVQIEGVEMASYLSIIRAALDRPKYIVLDWHNIESEVVTRHSSHAATPLHWLYMRWTAAQLKRIECELLDNCDLHLAMSERDRQRLLSRRPDANVIVVENGVDVDHFTNQFQGCNDETGLANRHRVLFVGSMDYYANVDGVLYLADRVWPVIHHELPSAVLTIVGRNPPEKVRKLGRRVGIEVTGTVGNVRPYYDEAFVVVVPLRMGGGTRLKILEAMAAGVPVVSTTFGAEGLRIEPGIHLRLADTPADFCRQIRKLRVDLQLWRRVSVAGRKLVETHYDWNAIGSKLVASYLNLLNAGPTNRSFGDVRVVIGQEHCN